MQQSDILGGGSTLTMGVVPLWAAFGFIVELDQSGNALAGRFYFFCRTKAFRELEGFSKPFMLLKNSICRTPQAPWPKATATIASSPASH